MHLVRLGISSRSHCLPYIRYVVIKIYLCLLIKFLEAPQVSASEKRVPTIQRILKRSRASSSKEDEPAEPVEPVQTASTSRDGQEVDDVIEYKVGQLYDLKLLYDCRGSLFQNSECKLVQHEILDTNHKIIPPWDQYAALRTGTLVMATVTLHCFTMKVKDLHGVETGKQRKVRVFSRCLRIRSPFVQDLPDQLSPAAGHRR